MKRALAVILSYLIVATPAFADRTVYAPVRLAPVATAETILFADGTAAAPSMSFSADPDTGIYRVGNNRLGLSTSGAGRVFIDEVGWFYVGNAIASSAPLAGTITGTLGSGTNITGGDLRLNGGSGTGSGAGGNVIIRTSAAGASGSTANGFTERMRITSAGDVGIGTNAPTQINGGKVTHVYTNSNTSTIADNQDFIVESVNRNTSLYLRSSNTSAATLHFGDQANSGIGRIQYDHVTDGMTFRTNAADRMTITSAGEVFLGNGQTSATPASPKLRATGGTGTNIAGGNLDLFGGNCTGNAAGGAVSVWTSAAGPSGTATNAAFERMRVKPNGQLRFIPLAADPAGAEAGDVYYNSGTNKLKVYNGTSWVDLH